MISTIVKESHIIVRHIPVMSSMIRMMSTTKRVLDVEEKKISVTINGDGQHKLLLMPGALGSAETDFGPQLSELNKEVFTVIGWDPPGYGGSRPPERNFRDFFFEDARFAFQTMSELGHQRYSLLGWSDGGITALILAAKFSANVDKVVIWGSNSYVSKSDIDMIEKVEDVSQWSPRMREPMENIYGDMFPSLWSQWVQSYRDIFKNGGDICSDILQNISAPTLIIHGEKDVMVAEEHVHYLADKIPNSRKMIWPGGKHNLHLKHAEEFNRIVQDFILE